MSDYTIHKDKARRERYRTRHQRDRIDDPYAPGFWSWWSLWGESSDLDTAFAAAVKRAKKILKQIGEPAMTRRRNPDLAAAQQQRIAQHLAKPIRSDGKLYTIRAWLEKLNAEGAVLKEAQVNKIKDMSRLAFNRASWKEQAEHARRQEEAGKVTEYRIEQPDGIFYVVRKIEADYFQSLASPLAEEQESDSGLPFASDEELDHLFGRKNPVREPFNFTHYKEHVMARRRNSAKPVIKETFTLYTPESVEAGDAADRGWIDEEGVDMTPDEYDREEGLTAVDKAVKHLRNEGVTQASSTSFYKGIWYCSMHEQNFRTGEQEERCFHLDGFSPEEERAIFEQMTARRFNPHARRHNPRLR